jgi:tetratricopeptide (TPR) repeat protein
MMLLRALMLTSVAAITLVASAVAASSQNPATPEATSLLGKPLVSAEPAAEQRTPLEENLARARTDFDRNPDDEHAIIWLGRRIAYLGRYREAIDVFSRGIAKHPESARLLRHRGHRYLTVREIDKAIGDFERAGRLVSGKPDEVEPDGAPNARNIPTSTLQSNIWYHLGLAYYVKGDFERALGAYRKCLDVSNNNDMLVATSHWLYMTLRRLKRDAEARTVLERITPGMEIIENDSYYQLLLMYKGVRTPESLLTESSDALANATVGYGVGNWYLYDGKPADARDVFNRIVAGTQWPSFGYLAAEAELARGQ